QDLPGVRRQVRSRRRLLRPRRLRVGLGQLMAVVERAAAAADYPAFVRFFAELAVPDPTPSQERFATQIAPNAVLLQDDGQPVGYGYAVEASGIGSVVHVV